LPRRLRLGARAARPHSFELASMAGAKLEIREPAVGVS
jgi:hypothetical protein